MEGKGLGPAREAVPPGIRRIPLAGGAAVAALGLLVLLGWAFHVEVLKSVLPGLVSMKPNTAVGLAAAGAAVVLLQGGRHARTRIALASIAGGIGLLTLAEYAADLDLGIDELLLRDDPGAIGTSHPGRMAPATALAFVLLSVGILTIGSGGGRLRRTADVLVVLASLLGLLALLAYLYGAERLSGLFGHTRMAAHTSGSFLLLGASVLLTRPGEGLLRPVALDTPEGVVARRLAIAAVGLPLLLGCVRLQGQRAGLYGTEFGLAAYTVSMVVALGGLVLWSASSLGEAAAERRLAEARLEEARERLQAIVDNATAVVYLKDAAGRYVLANREFEKVVARPRERILGCTDEDFVDAASVARIREEDRLALEGGTRTYEITVPTPSGVRTFLVSKFPLEDAEHGKVLCGVSVDITGRKAMEEELRRAKEAAEAAGRELEAFSYAVSHDLRAPLRSLDGFSLAIREDCRDRLDATGRDYLDRIRASAQRMGVLIDDLLDLSRVSRAELVRETVDLGAAAREIAAGIAAREPSRKVEWEIGEGVAARGDPRLLRVVLENLLENAWKYTARRAVARIEFGVDAADGAREYFVRDDGAGFAMEYAGRLFAPFQRLHSAREFPGTGIGLATVRRIVERHGGRVRAEGRPDAGAVFRFTLGEEDAS